LQKIRQSVLEGVLESTLQFSYFQHLDIECTISFSKNETSVYRFLKELKVNAYYNSLSMVFCKMRACATTIVYEKPTLDSFGTYSFCNAISWCK